MTNDDAVASTRWATRVMLAVAAKLPPSLGEHLYRPIAQAPLAVQHALGLLVQSVGMTETGQLIDRKLANWPPHRNRGTVRRCAHVGRKRAKNLAEKRKEGLCLGVVGGRLGHVDRGYLIKGARP